MIYPPPGPTTQPPSHTRIHPSPAARPPPTHACTVEDTPVALSVPRTTSLQQEASVDDSPDRNCFRHLGRATVGPHLARRAGDRDEVAALSVRLQYRPHGSAV
ncbi:hypothetical protein GGTG_09484 [Gaeumannomyces tritici R3-111a-1]|uniref:Uncharacterized protein n=1 Tax=Gaeumannomyces tritici (strain R3-111a-1) TaxID=644352 RepID=J3P7J2_GAET3|nr:hypothetical protein GGTG_09484 [Gaeumannomyces tritici R3-111a-1]EJT72624.1 hypothetical protein GGTG_09484 [Gaeumannomyces tritici R3-111a-1]